MVKFTARIGDRHLVGFGLSEANVVKLREGQPIHIHGESMGIDRMDFVILWGETEEKMREDLEVMIGEQTEVRDERGSDG